MLPCFYLLHCDKLIEGGEIRKKNRNKLSAAAVHDGDDDEEMYLFSTLGPGTPQHGPE